MSDDVRLQVLDEDTLHQLLEVAVADASPDEVMPPMAGPPGWTDARRQGFIAFFQPMLSSAETTIFAITVAGRIAGFMRLKRIADDSAETGMWLGRSWRSKGIGSAALRVLLETAARDGFRRVVADTTAVNASALGVLRRAGAWITTSDDQVRAEMAIARNSP